LRNIINVGTDTPETASETATPWKMA